MTRHFLPAAAGILAAVACGSASAQPAPTPSTAAANPWRAMLDEDLAFAQATLDKEYIYGVYPGGADWRALMDKAVGEARADEGQVTTAEAYQAVLRRFAGRFEDPHLRVSFKFAPASYDWPRFLVRHRGGHFLVVESETPDVAVGGEVTACDGAPIEDAVEQAAPVEGVIPHLESTRDSMARLLFLDAQSPLRHRPKICRIAGKDVTLDWAPIQADRLAVVEAPYASLRDHEVSISDFGDGGAWVRLGVFAPDKAAAADYHRVIAAMPTLRDKRVVVFDVRGNGGGPYDWFMAILKGFYGPEYAAHFAQARTEITPVFVHDPTYTGPHHADPLDTPRDTELDATYATGVKAITARGGATVYQIQRTPRPTGGAAPTDLVHAKVYVLTDTGCASACIGFVDELKRIPGAVQIGTDTYVDRRSGSPAPFAFPSGSGSISAPMMVRDGRERGENIPQTPAIRYDGDMADTAALKRWVERISKP